MLFRPIAFILMLACGSALADSSATLLGPGPAYAPRQTEYTLDLGLMTNRSDLFWADAIVGRNLGTCVFSSSETCQQYLDGLIGIAAAEGETQGHYLAGLRWQFVNVPDRASPFVRLLGGVTNTARPEGRGWHGVGGVGIGVATYLHEKVDLRVEARALASDRTYLQALVGFDIKVDRLLTIFALKLRDIGYGTVNTAIDAAGTAVRATGEGAGGIVRGVAKPFQKPTPTPTPTPTPVPRRKVTVPTPKP